VPVLEFPVSQDIIAILKDTVLPIKLPTRHVLLLVNVLLELLAKDLQVLRSVSLMPILEKTVTALWFLMSQVVVLVFSAPLMEPALMEELETNVLSIPTVLMDLTALAVFAKVILLVKLVLVQALFVTLVSSVIHPSPPQLAKPFLLQENAIQTETVLMDIHALALQNLMLLNVLNGEPEKLENTVLTKVDFVKAI